MVSSFESSGDSVEAFDDLQRALSLVPNSPEAAWNLGWIHLILGNFAQRLVSVMRSPTASENTKWVDLDGQSEPSGDACNEGKRIFFTPSKPGRYAAVPRV